MPNDQQQTLHDYVSKRGFEEVLPRNHAHLETRSFYEGLRCTAVLEKHTGCINALDWSDDGLLLASGSDDRQICIWSYPNTNNVVSCATDHTQNIFGVKFLPEQNDRIVSVGGDGLVQYHNVSPDGGHRISASWHCHEDRAKKVDTEMCNPNWFVTCSEDGTIRQFDIREPHTCDENGCTTNIVATWQDEDVSLNSLSVSQLRPQYIACAGTGSIVRVIDRRIQRNPSDQVQAWRNYDTTVWMPTTERESEMMTSCKFSAHSMDLISSVINGDVHLVNFDRLKGGNIQAPSIIISSEEGLWRALNMLWSRGKYEDYYDLITKSIAEHHRLQYSICDILCDILCCELYNRMLVSLRLGEEYQHAIKMDAREVTGTISFCLERLPTLQKFLYLLRKSEILSEDIPSIKIDEELANELDVDERKAKDMIFKMEPINVSLLPLWKDLTRQDLVCMTSQRRFKGHLNRRTVKDVTFVGPRHEFVASGSDGGFFFIWDKDDGSIVFMGYGDSRVVNCIAENPRIPAVAVGGVDHDIKLWQPGMGYVPLAESEATVRWRMVPPSIRDGLVAHLREDARSIIVPMTCPLQ